MSYYIYENTQDFMCEFLEMHDKFDMLCQHYHDTYEILFMTGGDRYAFVNNGMRHIKRGDVVILKPYVLHYSVSRESNYFKRYTLNFSKQILYSLLSDKECEKFLSMLHTCVINLDETNTQFVSVLFNDLLKYRTPLKLYDKKILASKLISLIDILKENSYSDIVRDSVDVTCSDGFADALNFINSNFTKELSLDFIIDYAHMSKSHFCRVFKKETGNTFLQYINNLRAAYAHSLLLETDMPVQKISEKAGFSSVLHFDRVFKKLHNASPSSIRKRNRI